MLSASRKELIKELLLKLNVQADNLELFDEALTHPSFNFEQNLLDNKDYERLEFLGDSVLRLALSSILFDKYTNYDEGNLSKIRSFLVSDEFLSVIAKKLELSKYLKIGKHEEKDGGRYKESILACASEAVLGAIYITKGFVTAKICIKNIYEKMDIDIQNILYSYNSKEILQQYTQKINKDLPEYNIINESGSEHNKIYEVNVVYRGEELGKGKAGTKKEAEKKAAFAAIKKLNLIKGDSYE